MVIEPVKDEDIERFFEDEEKKVEMKDNKRGNYQKMSWKQRLERLERYIAFKSNPQLIKGVPKSVTQFLRELGEDKGFKWETLKTLCSAYEKNKGLKTQLEIKCSNAKKASQYGQVWTRNSALS